MIFFFKRNNAFYTARITLFKTLIKSDSKVIRMVTIKSIF